MGNPGSEDTPILQTGKGVVLAVGKQITGYRQTTIKSRAQETRKSTRPGRHRQSDSTRSSMESLSEASVGSVSQSLLRNSSRQREQAPFPACQLSPSPQIAQAENRSKEGSLLTSSSDVTTEVSSNADQPVDEATATREQQEGAACRVQQKRRP